MTFRENFAEYVNFPQPLWNSNRTHHVENILTGSVGWSIPWENLFYWATFLKRINKTTQLTKWWSINGQSFFIYLLLFTSVINCSYKCCDLLSTWCCTLVHKLLLSLWLWIWFAHNLAEVAVSAVRTGGASTVVSPLFPHHCKQHSTLNKPINETTTTTTNLITWQNMEIECLGNVLFSLLVFK